MTNLYMPALLAALLAVAALSVLVAPRTRTVDGFFWGFTPSGAAPGVWTLTLSQVTTWIFARSLMNAGILGYFYGIAGVLAYATYYGSFLTGWLIIDRIRFVHGDTNIQGFLAARFGRVGTACFNTLISLRLLSEVFANLLVVGIVFGVAGTGSNTAAILAVAGVTLLYSVTGGLRASLRTDVLQMSLLVALLAVLIVVMLANPLFDAAAIATSSPDPQGPGWVLLIVALFQVLSYPMHDPVMMDRGFLADRQTTRRSFLRAFWISAACIIAFGLLGVFAGLHRAGEEDLLVTLERLLGLPAMLPLALALVISAASTLDSTLSSAAKLTVVDMRIGSRTPGNGRVAMALFCLGGLALVFLGPDDLFAAVAVSGTAALFLAPVIVFCILGGRLVALWSLVVDVGAALIGAGLYFLESAGYTAIVAGLTGLEHKYSQLLVITVAVLAVGHIAFALGVKPRAGAGSRAAAVHPD